MGDFDPGKALDIVYGNSAHTWNPGRSCREGVPSSTRQKWDDSDRKNIAQLGTTEAGWGPVASFVSEGTDKKYLITGTSRGSCRGCGTILGISLWTRTGDRWCLSKVNRCLDLMGDLGEIYEERMKVVKIGPEKYAMLYYQIDDGQGYSYAWYAIIAENKKDFSTQWYEAKADNSGACGSSELCWGYKSKIRFVPGKNPEYYDMAITYRGTNEVEREAGSHKYLVLPWNKTVKFAFKDGVFVKKHP